MSAREMDTKSCCSAVNRSVVLWWWWWGGQGVEGCKQIGRAVKLPCMIL